MQIPCTCRRQRSAFLPASAGTAEAEAQVLKRGRPLMGCLKEPPGRALEQRKAQIA
eukprot:CAMPEP_0179013440 /NCGR_PEP_ID=MMETSP0796-20121207/1727_1 /TAXON_ID=73915 /ORGANISM="Pyrodinium bahamense, Strain pbaha01" /LENGTH=55 /DNA_ID=CAMNT_0020708943 /DNA_START=135 /DNA_END=298 /DNA_ORIENTATION=-